MGAVWAAHSPSVTLTSKPCDRRYQKEAAAHQARADALIWVGAFARPRSYRETVVSIAG